MTRSDISLLLEMGFEKARAELAVKQTGDLQGALQWLEDNQDASLDELQAKTKNAEAGEAGDEGSGPQAQSLVCNECGKLFKNSDLATYHASKSGHTDFSESTEEIKPLTEEEKKARLEELRGKLQAKRAMQSDADREQQKRNDQIRMKATRDTQDLKEERERQEQIKIAAQKRKEKLADIEAKKRIKAKIEADKEERRRKAEMEKAAREGHLVGDEPTAPPTAAQLPPSYQEAIAGQGRLRIATANGTVMKTLPAETTLMGLVQMLKEEKGVDITSFTQAFPRRVFEGPADMGLTLREAGMTPSASLIAK